MFRTHFHTHLTKSVYINATEHGRHQLLLIDFQSG